MRCRKFHRDQEIRLRLPIPGFPTAEEAERLDWRRKITLPPGSYLVRSCESSDVGADGDRLSNGVYYEVTGAGHAWVRENYLLAGQRDDWPWLLTECLEPLDWVSAWDAYLRSRVESSPPAPSHERLGEPLPDLAEAVTQVDEYGVRAAPPNWLPDFDDAFELVDRFAT